MRFSTILLVAATLAGCSPAADDAKTDEAPAGVPEAAPVTGPAAISEVDWAAFQASAPQVLKDSLAEADDTCRSDGGRINVGVRGIRSADINGDGRPDYFVDYGGGVGCAGAESAQSAFCGSGGMCGYDVFVSGTTGYVRQEFLLQGPELRQRDGRVEVLDGGGKVLGWTGSKVDVIPAGG